MVRKMYKYISECEAAFNEEVRTKKTIARSAKYRASRGTRAITVHNQSDNLTKKELKAMSSEVIAFKMKPMKWEEFNHMTIAAQKKYVEWLRDEYKASARKIADMLGANQATFFKYNKNNLWVEFKYTKMSARELERWEEFCNINNTTPTTIDTPCGKLRQCDISAYSVEELIQLLRNIEPVLEKGQLCVNICIVKD